MKIPWWVVALALVTGLVGGYCYGHRKPEAKGIEKRAKELVEDSLPVWQARDRADSIADAADSVARDSISRVADSAKAVALKIRFERDSLRKLTTASQDSLDSLASRPPPAAREDHEGVNFWHSMYQRQKRLAADYRLEADLARQGDAGFLGTIRSLENAAAVDAKRIGRLKDQVDRVIGERDKAVATLDTLRRFIDCSGPLGIPCPEVGIGLGVTVGPSTTLPPKIQVTPGVTVGLYFPVKKIRI